MIILRQKTFSKNKENAENPNLAGYIAAGGINAYIGSKLGKVVGKNISKINQFKEVHDRLENELPKRAAAGDKKAAEFLSKASSNPKQTMRLLNEAVENSPRTKKAGKIGKYVGIAIPTADVAASYAYKKHKYNKSKKNKEK